MRVVSSSCTESTTAFRLSSETTVGRMHRKTSRVASSARIQFSTLITEGCGFGGCRWEPGKSWPPEASVSVNGCQESRSPIPGRVRRRNPPPPSAKLSSRLPIDAAQRSQGTEKSPESKGNTPRNRSEVDRTSRAAGRSRDEKGKAGILRPEFSEEGG